MQQTTTGQHIYDVAATGWPPADHRTDVAATGWPPAL